MLRQISFAMPFFLLPLLACAAKKGPDSKDGTTGAPASWTCPDTLWYAISEATPAVSGRPWKAPTQWGRDTAASPKVHPELIISVGGIKDGNSKASDKHFVEPNFPWVGDLNGDGLTDFIVRDGIGFSKETAVLVNCGNGKYFPVFQGMMDEVFVEEDPAPSRGWKRLQHRYLPFGSEESHHDLMRWDGHRYMPICEFRVPSGSPLSSISAYCP